MENNKAYLLMAVAAIISFVIGIGFDRAVIPSKDMTINITPNFSSPVINDLAAPYTTWYDERLDELSKNVETVKKNLNEFIPKILTALQEISTNGSKMDVTYNATLRLEGLVTEGLEILKTPAVVETTTIPTTTAPTTTTKVPAKVPAATAAPKKG